MVSLLRAFSSSRIFHLPVAPGLSSWSNFSVYTYPPTVIFSRLNKWLPKVSSGGHVFLGHFKFPDVPCSMVVSEPMITWPCICDALLYSRMVLGIYEAVLGVQIWVKESLRVPAAFRTVTGNSDTHKLLCSFKAGLNQHGKLWMTSFQKFMKWKLDVCP